VRPPPLDSKDHNDIRWKRWFSHLFKQPRITESLSLNISSDQEVTASGGITPTSPIMLIQGDTGATTVTANPQISAGVDGQMLMLYGSSDSHTVTLNDGDGLHLHSKAILGDKDVIVLVYSETHEEWGEITRNFSASEKSWAFKSPTGSSGTFYYGGYYDFGATDNNFNPAATHGTALASYAAHFFVVQAAGGAGGVDTVLRVTGTKINDEGTRTAGKTVDITVSNTGAVGTYYETSEKWIGQVSISKVSGPDLLCNYGFCKYWDNNNNDFKVVGIEVTWLAGATDAAPNFCLRHHKATGWTYNAGSTPSPPTFIADMNTNHVTEIKTVNGENGAWKRDNLSTKIAGAAGEGTIFEVNTSVNKAYDLGNVMLRIQAANV